MGNRVGTEKGGTKRGGVFFLKKKKHTNITKKLIFLPNATIPVYFFFSTIFWGRGRLLPFAHFTTQILRWSLVPSFFHPTELMNAHHLTRENIHPLKTIPPGGGGKKRGTNEIGQLWTAGFRGGGEKYPGS